MTETDFGTIISELRIQKKLSQKALAKEIGVHVATIKNWESNRCTPDAKNICALADLFDVTADSLLVRKEAKTIPLPNLSDGEHKQLLGIIQGYLDNRVLPKQK